MYWTALATCLCACGRVCAYCGAYKRAECPFDGGYDYKIGTSARATLSVDDRKFKVPPFKHLLLVLGGSDGVEDSVENDDALGLPGAHAHKLFNAFVRTTPQVADFT